MSTPLDRWQESLERHFDSLAASRGGSGFPIFALEHGLTSPELEEIGAALRSRLKDRLRLSSHWLLWIIYATERGYAYAGDEYWTSFEEQTPHWESGDRYKILSWFKKFQKAYNGVTPSGPWANHFRIIAWPITHAVLPQYLQLQFARTLYDLRFRLAGVEALEPSVIGRLLAANSYSVSTRFETFLQQEELTGRIVMALLGQTPEDSEALIYGPTLQRIVGDLEQVRNARAWLTETRRHVRDRFSGIGRGTYRPRHASEEPESGPGRLAPSSINVRPNVLLRYAGAQSWSAVLDAPSFKSVAAMNPDVRSFLRSTRCRPNGADDWKPRGWLVSGQRRAALKFWPDTDKPLLQLERSNGIVDHLLETGCRLSSGPVWLFRIGSDGTAREIIGRIVRPGCDYILVTNEAFTESTEGLDSCNVNCEGIRSFRLRVPPEISANHIVWLKTLGLDVARTIRVWPAGLPARGWDGEGHSEWLTTETPCFGIVHDHPVDAYALRLDNGAENLIAAGPIGSPVFVQLSPLPTGRHTLLVKARRHSFIASSVSSPPPEGFIELVVREPQPWVFGTAPHSGLIVSLDPHDADLDTFWGNAAKLSVLGPPSHKATCSITLETSKGEQVLSEQVDGPMNLPITPDTWKSKFDQFTKVEDFAWRYLDAAAGNLTIQADELGHFVIRLEREILPLRWVLRNTSGNIVLKLIDDTDQENAQLKILFCEMNEPARVINRAPKKFGPGLVVEPPGGLFIARRGRYNDTIIVSALSKGAGLQGLGVAPVFSNIKERSVSLPHAFRVLDFWLDARLAGFHAGIRRQKIVDAFLIAIFSRLCGPEWARGETEFYTQRGAQRAIDFLQLKVQKRSGFGASLRRDHDQMADDPESRTQWYWEKAKRYGICSDKKLCDFALKLASEPNKLRRMCGNELDELIEQASENKVLVRGARLIALLSASKEHNLSTDLLPRWNW